MRNPEHAQRPPGRAAECSGGVSAAPLAVTAAESPGHWQPVYLGLGSNLGDPAARVRAAFDALQGIEGLKLVRRSPLYVTPPMGPPDQPDYVNAVAGALTRLSPQALLGELKALESRLGRSAATVRWGPRIIDIDILVFGRLRLELPGLTIPHQGIADRAFVLGPLADVAPGLHVPGAGQVEALLARVSTAGMHRLQA